MRLEYHKNLDGLRAIAALMVMFFHFFRGEGIAITSEHLRLWAKISILGQSGVTLFFVLSGFLITRILISTKYDANYFKVFYIRRGLRIFPLYYFFLICYYFLPALFYGSSITPFKEQLCFYTYMQSFASTFKWKVDGPGHFWSLAVEEHFYLFWPIVVYLLSTKNLYRVIIGIIVGAIILRVYMLTHAIEIHYFTFTRFDSLAAGALLAVLETNGVFTEKNAKKFTLLALIGSFLTILIWILFTGKQSMIIQIFKYDFDLTVYFGIIGAVLCLRKESKFSKLLCSPFLLFTGKISYGLYVFHPFAFAIARGNVRFDFWPFSLLIAFSLTFVLAILCYYILEKRFLSIKRFYVYKAD